MHTMSDQSSSINTQFHPVVEGDFTFVKDKMWRTTLENAYKYTTELNMWTFFKEETPPQDTGYMFWNEPKLERLRNALDSDGHSGANMSICLRNMEYIAKHGWDNYVKKLQK